MTKTQLYNSFSTFHLCTYNIKTRLKKINLTSLVFTRYRLAYIYIVYKHILYYTGMNSNFGWCVGTLHNEKRSESNAALLHSYDNHFFLKI